jgi:tetratricopeptide (TPR) repeat protein
MRYIKNFILLLIIGSLASCNSDGAKTEAPKKDSSVVVSDSLSLLNLAISKDPENSANYTNRAKYFLRKKQFEKALADINVCLAKDSTNPELLLVKIDIYYFGKNIDEANNTLKKSLSYNSNHLETLLKNAEFQYYLKRYNEAITSINTALKMDVNNAKGYFLKGMIFKEKGDTLRAISSFITATEQNPEYYEAYMQLGNIQAAKNAPIASKYFQNALKININSEEAWYALGVFLQSNNPNIKLAKDAYQNTLNINPSNKNAHYNLGAIGFVEKEYLKASKHFTDAIIADSTFSSAYYARGLCYKKINYKTEAKADLKTYLRFVPDDNEAKSQLNGL